MRRPMLLSAFLLSGAILAFFWSIEGDASSVRSPGATGVSSSVCVDTSVTTEFPLNLNVTVAGNLAFLSKLQNGLDVYDVSVPGAPVRRDYYRPPGRVLSVAVSGEYAYLCNEDFVISTDTVDRGIAILSIADPSNISPVSLLTEPRRPEAAQVMDSLLFVADANPLGSKLWIVDVSDPFAPHVIGSFGLTHTAKGLSVVDSLAYLAISDGGLVVLNVADPTSPEFVGSLSSVSPAYDVFVRDSVAYVARLQSGIALVNVSNPASPTLLSSFDTPGSAFKVRVAGDLAHVADQTGGYVVVDISDPVNPQPVEAFQSGNQVLGLYPTGTHTFAAEGPFFTVYAIQETGYCGDGVVGPCEECDPGLPLCQDLCLDCRLLPEVNHCELARFDPPGDLSGIAVEDSILYVTDGTKGLQIYSIRHPAEPLLVGGVNTTGYTLGVAVQGNLVAIADSMGLFLVDVTSPQAPFKLGSLGTPKPIHNVRLVDTVAYLSGPDSLRVVDVSDPAAPILLGSAPVAGPGYALDTHGSRVYVASGTSGLFIVDVSDPTLPAVVGTYNSAGTAWGVDVQGDTVYLADGEGGLVSLEVSDPAHPTVLALRPSWYPHQVQRYAQVVFVVSSASVTLLYDARFPTSLPPLASSPYLVSYGSYDLIVKDGYAIFQEIETVSIFSLSVTCSNQCGNGVVEPGEPCDDGNTSAGDGCTACCQLEPPPSQCGNGTVESGEECDDGNQILGDGCDALCQREPSVCGNGIVEYGEECDAGGSLPFDSCLGNCQIARGQLCRGGDANQSGTITSSDIIHLVNYIFKGGAAPVPCPYIGDVNCSGTVTSADIIRLVGYIFIGSTPPCDVCNQSPLRFSC